MQSAGNVAMMDAPEATEFAAAPPERSKDIKTG
jgi:hypothetical protein